MEWVLPSAPLYGNFHTFLLAQNIFAFIMNSCKLQLQKKRLLLINKNNKALSVVNEC